MVPVALYDVLHVALLHLLREILRCLCDSVKGRKPGDGRQQHPMIVHLF